MKPSLRLALSMVTPGVAHAAPKAASLAERDPAEDAIGGERAAVDYAAAKLSTASARPFSGPRFPLFASPVALAS
jgi:hypothetical protein